MKKNIQNRPSPGDQAAIWVSQYGREGALEYIKHESDKLWASPNPFAEHIKIQVYYLIDVKNHIQKMSDTEAGSL